MPFYAIDGIAPVVNPSSFVHPTACLIGDVIIGPNCYIGPGASLRGDFGRLVLEKGANIQDNCIMHGYPDGDTVIEEDGHIGHGAILHCCTIRKNAMVGMNAVVIDGAEVGENSIIAAMAFVKMGMKIPPNVLVAGIPAKIIRELGPEELNFKHLATLEYQHLATRSLNSLQECQPLREVEPNRGKMRFKHLPTPYVLGK